MSSVALATYPTLNPTSQPWAFAQSAMDPTSLNALAGIADTSMADMPITHHLALDPCANSRLPLPLRTIAAGFTPFFPTPFAPPPMVPLPYPGNNLRGVLPNRLSLRHANATIPQYESISDLLSPDTPDFEYNDNLHAALHTGKCQDCVRFGMHIVMPGNNTRYLRAMKAHDDAALGTLNDEIVKLNTNARIAAKNLDELKDALQSSQQRVASLRDQRDKLKQENGNLLADNCALARQIRELEQPPAVAPYCPTRASDRPLRHPSPSCMRAGMPYERPSFNRPTQRPPAQASFLLEPERGGNIIMASVPTNIRSARMAPNQPQYDNPRPCNVSEYRWKSDNGTEMVGLPRTRAGTYYIPNELGLAWYRFENSAPAIGQVYRRIDLLYRNTKGETWRAAVRSAFEACRLIDPFPTA